MVLMGPMNSSTARYVLVRCAGEAAALPAAAVAEILPVARLSRPAGAPKVLAGFMNLGGAALPVVNLAAVFGAVEADPQDIYRHVVRLRPDVGGGLGLLVERVLDAAAVAQEVAALEPDQSVGGVLAANLRFGDDLVPLIDLAAVLLAEEALRLEELSAAAQARLDDGTP
jgi:purine-binding chemotaxis protein CheW